jgi:hypothetical protein
MSLPAPKDLRYVANQFLNQLAVQSGERSQELIDTVDKFMAGTLTTFLTSVASRGNFSFTLDTNRFTTGSYGKQEFWTTVIEKLREQLYVVTITEGSEQSIIKFLISWS